MRRTFLLASVVTMAVVLVVWLAGASASTGFPYAIKTATSASAASGPNAREHACGSGFVHVLVRGKHVCRAAPDLRVAVVATPGANRVGGTITFAVTVTNAGRAVSRRVVLGAVAPAEYVSASSSVSTCSSPPGVLRTTCALGTLRPKAKATATISVRATALGPLRLSARASSATPDAKARDNSTSNAARITEPDSVRGSGRRLLFGTTGQENAIFVEVDAISGPQGRGPRRNLVDAKSRDGARRRRTARTCCLHLRPGEPRDRRGHYRAVSESPVSAGHRRVTCVHR